MPMQITSPDGRVLWIRTEVGDGQFARVIVEEQPRELPAMEPEEQA